ncbi:lytic transglycosylase domain-containing protein [Chitinophagales bacterium]|nr:lytic transglycosylase domain-containing protein [Chitinophagales bacterium]
MILSTTAVRPSTWGRASILVAIGIVAVLLIGSQAFSIYQNHTLKNRIEDMSVSVEMEYNPAVVRSIHYFLFKKRRFVEHSLTTASMYEATVDRIFREEGIPIELKYLAVVESSFNPTAVSSAGATGIWQFMSATARMEDLEVNAVLDERRDPSKATRAAAHYLKRLYKRYDNWLLALAAYNCGPGNINKAMRRCGGDDYWSIRSCLPKETQNYVPSYLAVVYLHYYKEEHGLIPAETKIDLRYSYTLAIDEETDLSTIAERSNCSVQSIRKLNPELLTNRISKRLIPFELKMPMSESEKQISDDLQKSAEEHAQTIDHSNRKGIRTEARSIVLALDSLLLSTDHDLDSLANATGSSLEELRYLNKAGNRVLEIGEVIYYPKSSQ